MFNILLIWRTSSWFSFFVNRRFTSSLFRQRGSTYNFFGIFFNRNLSNCLFCIINNRSLFYIRRLIGYFICGMRSNFFSFFINLRICGLLCIIFIRRNICFLFFMFICWRRNACLFFMVNNGSFSWCIICFFDFRRWSLLCIIFSLSRGFISIFNFRSHRFFCI